MVMVPMFINGRSRVVWWPDNDGTAVTQAKIEMERARRLEIWRRRQYIDGAQFDAENAIELKKCFPGNAYDPERNRLPEHKRLHAYSIQIGESVAFLADQLADGFAIETKNTEIQQILVGMVQHTDRFRDDNDQMVIDDVLSEMLGVGDVPYLYKWDPVAGVAYVELWEAETVIFDQDRVNEPPKQVVREEAIFVQDPITKKDKQVIERVVYRLVDAEDRVHQECIAETFWDNDDSPRSTERLGVPFIPWGLLRGDRKGLRQVRGESLVRHQAMDAADRYNANEQLSYVISRYNSHGNIVIIGDGAEIKLESAGHIERDVADALAFPTGTQVIPLTLPTDPRMIEHQRAELADAIYATFGLTRVDPSTMEGLGQVSGYALEILNRKTEGTFKRVRRQVKKDLKALVHGLLDFTVFMKTATFDDDGQLISVNHAASPESQFGNREMEIRLGSGYIVDDVQLRDDFSANLVSRRYVLRQRGLEDSEIDKIEREIANEKPAETSAFGVNGSAPPVGTQAGRTLSTTTRQ